MCFFEKPFGGAAKYLRMPKCIPPFLFASFPLLASRKPVITKPSLYKNQIDKVPAQQYSCVMIPDAIDISGVWNVLPPGIHDASMAEIEQRFATSPHRENLFAGFKRGVQALHAAGCKTIFLDGSYVTTKTTPGDFDACWDPSGVNPHKIDPVLLDFSNMRQNQKQKYGGEFFPSSAKADGFRTFLEYFQIDKHTGKPKGVIRVQLS